MERKEQGTVQALERGLKILELLMQEKRPMGVNEIAKCQGITPSAAYRILNRKLHQSRYPDVRRQIHSGREVILCHGEK